VGAAVVQKLSATWRANIGKQGIGMDAQWLLLGGPADGEVLLVASDLGEIRIDADGTEHRYVRHIFALSNALYCVGVHSSCDMGEIDNVHLASRIRALGIAPVQG